MNRRLCYFGAIPQEVDLLNVAKDAMMGAGKLAEAVAGTGTIVRGFAVAANSPAALNVVVSPGAIYQLKDVDATDYSSIAADTDHQIVKQGLLLDAQTLNCAAPGTTGKSINYLIQVTLTEADQDSTLLPYFNSSNPAQPYLGPNNNGLPQAVTRACNAVVSAKAGTAANTGTQATPSPDSGCVGVAVVTVAYGATTITSGNISTYTGKPILPADGMLWDARSGKLGKSTTGGDTVLTAAEYANPIIELTGTLTTNGTLVLPNVSGQWIISNQTTGSYALSLSNSPGGTDQTVPQGSAVVAYTDGAGNVLLAASNGGGGSSGVTKTTFTATAAQTSFTMTYTPGTVFLVTDNGVSVDYDDSSGTAVVLSTPALLNDEVVVFVADDLVAADFYTKAQVDAKVSPKFLVVRDEKASGTDGGTFTNGAWRIRTLNTSASNTISGASLGSNQITLPAGTYQIDAWAGAFNVGSHATKLYNVTDSADALIGSTENTTTGADPATTKSSAQGIITITGTKVFELRHQCGTTKSTTGFGKAAGFGVVEVYASVMIRQLA